MGVFRTCLMVLIIAFPVGGIQRKAANTTSEKETASAIIILSQQHDIKRLSKILDQDSEQRTRQARHEEIIKALQATAQSTQKPLLKYLAEQRSAGKVEDCQSFWIVNAVWVKATTSVVEEIAQRFDVAEIYREEEIGPIEPIKPVEIKKDSGQKGGAESGLKAIKADCLWVKGINGAGILVCNIDTGVNGNHPVLYSRWRGNNGATAQESWFDPYNNSSFPVDDWENTHGTMTMGIMIGMSDNDTVGVAFGAQWIAANAMEKDNYFLNDIYKNFLACFQWAADPDGNPMTDDAVPDVINGSFYLGGYRRCSDFLWEVIDAVEAAGVVTIFAAGNEGKKGAYTIANPANRATTPVNTFAVGAVDENNIIADFSSRGPSICDSVSIKPEVVAPGVNIRSLMGEGYGSGKGTSYAAPHVSGAVTLLRQINPDATVEEVKYALLNSAVDLGPEGEDNSYGMGIIDVNAAAKLLPPNIRPNINISKFTINSEHTHFKTVIRDSAGDMPQFLNFDITQINIALMDTFITVYLYTDSTEEVISDYFSSLLIETVLDTGSNFTQNMFLNIFIDKDQNIFTGEYPPHVYGLSSTKIALQDIGADFVIFVYSDPCILIWPLPFDPERKSWQAAKVPFKKGQILASGLYLYRAKIGNFTETKKMLLIR